MLQFLSTQLKSTAAVSLPLYHYTQRVLNCVAQFRNVMFCNVGYLNRVAQVISGCSNPVKMSQDGGHYYLISFLVASKVIVSFN